MVKDVNLCGNVREQYDFRKQKNVERVTAADIGKLSYIETLSLKVYAPAKYNELFKKDKLESQTENNDIPSYEEFMRFGYNEAVGLKQKHPDIYEDYTLRKLHFTEWAKKHPAQALEIKEKQERKKEQEKQTKQKEMISKIETAQKHHQDIYAYQLQCLYRQAYNEDYKKTKERWNVIKRNK